jgi:hypothetical protein
MTHVSTDGQFADYPDQLVLQALLATELASFTEFAFSVVRPNVQFNPNWHLDAVTDSLSDVALGYIRRLIITMPPRNLKSLCASVALPAWFLGRFPWERVVVVSYSDFLARTHANDFRLVVNHPLYQATFPVSGFPCSFAESVREARDRSLAALPYSGTSTARRLEIQRDANEE